MNMKQRRTVIPERQETYASKIVQISSQRELPGQGIGRKNLAMSSSFSELKRWK
jgi:hypothetical protein